jgi:hypothetical protein
MDSSHERAVARNAETVEAALKRRRERLADGLGSLENFDLERVEDGDFRAAFRTHNLNELNQILAQAGREEAERKARGEA